MKADITNGSSGVRAGFVLEQALGHVTYGLNIERYVAERSDVDPRWMRIPFNPDTAASKMPVVRTNWTLRASIEARRQLRDARHLDALFLHTQTVSLFASGAMRRVPTVLSLDATPLNFDAVGAAYDHRSSPGPIEALKQRLYRRTFAQAAAFTTWSQWAKDSLVRDYRVDPSLVRVLHPGADLELFDFGRTPRPVPAGRPVRILLVGGDLERKGGNLLIDLARNELRGRCELELVTSAAIPNEPGVYVHNGVGPNSPELLQQYRDADLFVLPTRGECLAVVLGEAMAAGLPIITTDVGGHGEAVRDGETGFLLPRPDRALLLERITRFIDNPALLPQMGARGRAHAEDRFDSRKNVHAIADMLVDVAARHRKEARSTRLEPREGTA